MQSDLLSLIDSTGNGITTAVKRSWDTTAVRLALEGTWFKSGEARKMAMLAVYQVLGGGGERWEGWGEGRGEGGEVGRRYGERKDDGEER